MKVKRVTLCSKKPQIRYLFRLIELSSSMQQGVGKMIKHHRKISSSVLSHAETGNTGFKCFATWVQSIKDKQKNRKSPLQWLLLQWTVGPLGHTRSPLRSADGTGLHSEKSMKEIWFQGPTCTDRCRSGSSPMPPPASVPHPLSLYRGGVCRRGKCKTSRAPARTERPTPTACPGSIATTSLLLLFSAYTSRSMHMKAGAVKRGLGLELGSPSATDPRLIPQTGWSMKLLGCPLPGGLAQVSGWKSV